MSEPDLVFTNDWALTKAFTKLEAIELYDDEVRLAEDFFLDLQQLSNLTFLSGDCLRRDSLTASLLHPIGLASLELHAQWSDAELFPLFLSYKHLTHLTLYEARAGSSLTCLTGLKELKLSGMIPDAERDWTKILSCMQQLERLDIHTCRCQFPSSCLSPLKELESLSLNSVTLDIDFFDAVTVLARLTQLHLIYCDGIDCSGLSKVNRLTDLQDFGLLQFKPLDPCSYVENGRLLRLRNLWLPKSVISEAVEKELFERLPSLRQVREY